MADRKQIIFCTDGIFPHAVGGMQRHSALLIKELAQNNQFDIIVIHSHDKKVLTDLPNVKEYALNFQLFKLQYINYLYKCYQFSKEVYTICKQYPNAIIYSQGFAIWHGIREIGYRVIVNPHGLEPFQAIELKDRVITTTYRTVQRHQFKYAAKVVSLGGRLTEILRNSMAHPDRKIIVLPNATNPDSYQEHNYDKEVLQLLFVGRFAFNKGINILMECVRQLNNEGYQNRLQFNLVGKGPLFDKYVKEYSFPNVNFIGFADDDYLKRLYLENDLFVFPTLFEGMPTVVLEAMAGGMPIVVSDTGATSELVNSGNGFLIEKNNIRSLKSAIQQFFQLRPEQRKMLSINSYEKVCARFTWPVVAKQHAELFNTFSTTK